MRRPVPQPLGEGGRPDIVELVEISWHIGTGVRMTSAMLLKVLFWLFAALDLAVIGLWFVLGLAAAGPSKTSPFAVALALLVVPGALLAGAILLFVRTESAGWRWAALLVVSGPALALGVSSLVSMLALPGAIAGTWGSTPLTRALSDLQKDPNQLAVVRQLLADGADPNQGGDELPLVLAIYAVRHVGLEPLRLLLDAGANPNAKTQWGEPAFFAVLGNRNEVAELQLLLDRGAAPKTLSRSGHSGLWQAAATRNWPAALLLAKLGASWQGISPMGLPYLAMLEGEVRQHGATGPLAELIDFVKKAK